MSPHFNYDPSAVSTSIEVFDKGDYEFIVGKPKAFQKIENGAVKNFGVRFAVTIADGIQKDKRTVYTCYLHTDGSLSATKRFQMACLGYKNGKAEEERFNKDQTGKDWSCDFDSGECGEAWQELAGKRVIGTLDIQPNPNTGEPSQNFKAWRSISA